MNDTTATPLENARRERWLPGRPWRPDPTRRSGDANVEWWPERLNLKILAKNPAVANPLGEDFDYAEAFKSLDLDGGQAGHRRGLDPPLRTGGRPTSATTVR